MIYLDVTPEAQAIKEKVDKWDCMKIFLICASKYNINTVKKQPREWEIIFASHISDKGLISRNYGKLLKLNNKITQFKNGQRT